MSAAPRQAIDVVRDLCARFAERDCLADRVPTSDGSIVFAPITYRRVWERSVALSNDWTQRQLVAPGERVIICGEGSSDWIVADIACLYSGAVTVPLSANLPADDLEHIVRETAPVLMVCSHATAPLVCRLAAACPSARALIIIDDAGGPPVAAPVPSWRIAELEATSRAPWPPAVRAPDDVVAVIYTSGGTGRPKGVPLRDRNHAGALTLRAAADMKEVRSVCYLPLSHVMGRAGIVYAAFALGGTVYFVATQDMGLLVRAIQTVRPTFLTLIPAVSNFLYQQYRALVAARLAPGADAAAVVACERATLAEIRKTMLGDSLRSIRTGSAPTAPEVRDFLHAFAPVLDFYSSSELGLVTLNDELLPDIEYRLEDVPELGYARSDKPFPRGELLIRSWRSISGYYNRPDSTERYREADGFVRTGDIFEERAPRRIVWIDRRNTVIKLANGEFVALSRLEHLFTSSCPRIQQLFIYGNSERDHLLAVVVPHQSSRSQATSAAFKQLVRADLEQAARAAQLPGHEIPRDFIVELEPFTPANQLLTDSGKLRRPALKARYEAALEALYASIAERRAAAAPPPDAALTVRERVVAVAAVALGLPRGDVDAETSFVALGGDSLGAVSIATHLEAQLGRAPSVGAILDRNVTLAELARRLEDELGGVAGAPGFASIHPDGQREVRADELRLERFLADELAAPRRPTGDEPRTLLLTGGNGFLGRFLVLALLERLPSDGRLVVLVRAADDAAARARLVAGLAPSGREALARFEALARDRLVVRAGDLTRPRFALAAADYDALADRVDAVVHNGALVNHALGYRQLFEPNVLGTIEVLRFALRTRLKPLSFVSSIAVAAGARRTGPVGEHEDAVALWPRRPTGAVDQVLGFGYATTKWAGEILVRDYAARTGGGVTIFRCGSLLAHSTWPRQINGADSTTRLFASIAATGLAPRSFFAAGFAGPRGLDGVPVDHAAAVIAAVALSPRPEPRLYHVARRPHAGALGLDDVVDILARAGRIRARPERYEDWFTAFAAALGGLDKDAQSRSALPLIERWRQPIAGVLELDTTRLGDELARLTGTAEFPALGEGDVLRWLRDVDAS